MNHLEEVKRLLELCDSAQREEVFRLLRRDCSIHPLEKELHATAEIILEAIHRAGGLTLKMFRGVIAQAAFGANVVDQLIGWENISVTGDPAYDFELADSKGRIRVQVKLQRSKGGAPLLARNAAKSFRALPQDMYVVETQRTRGGKKGSGALTRPYRFGEFDLLAVAMYPTTKKWDTFMYTVADWLTPDPKDQTIIFKYQPVASLANEDWTDSFHTAVSWKHRHRKKCIKSQ